MFFALFVTQVYWIYNEIFILLQYVENDIYMDTYSNVTQHPLLGILTPTVFSDTEFRISEHIKVQCVNGLYVHQYINY